MSKNQSIQTEHTVINGQTVWKIKGYTRPYADQLKEAGATWDGKLGCWVCQRTTLTLAIQDILRDLRMLPPLSNRQRAKDLKIRLNQRLSESPEWQGEPDGTCPWMIENQRGLLPGQDWLVKTESPAHTVTKPRFKLDQRVTVNSHKHGTVKAILWGANRTLVKIEGERDSWFDDDELTAAHEITPDVSIPSLPVRQVEFLVALAEGKPVTKNAATRKALRGHGCITGEDDWSKIQLTERGRKVLAALILNLPDSKPDTPQEAQNACSTAIETSTIEKPQIEASGSILSHSTKTTFQRCKVSDFTVRCEGDVTMQIQALLFGTVAVHRDVTTPFNWAVSHISGTRLHGKPIFHWRKAVKLAKALNGCGVDFSKYTAGSSVTPADKIILKPIFEQFGDLVPKTAAEER